MSIDVEYATAPGLDFERLPVLSQVENDRFCDCGYNLRMQGVRRDPRLDILLVRCPECSRYHPVALAGSALQVWFQRFSHVLMIGYLLLVVALVAGLGAAYMGISMGTIDELSRRRYVTAVQAGGRVNVWQETGLALYQQPQHPDYILAMALGSSGSVVSGFFGVALAAVLFHHWRRRGYAAFALAIPLMVAMILWLILLYEPPRLQFAPPYVGLFAALQAAGGAAAIWLARPMARRLVRLFLPPRTRPYLAFLWSADGLDPPMKR